MYLLPDLLEALNELHLCQRKVSELKSVHNKLHQIELQLEGLWVTIQLQLLRTQKDFEVIKISWEYHVIPTIDDIKDFAADEMQFLEDERFRIDNGNIQGPKWVIELIILQNSFQASMEEPEIGTVNYLTRALLSKCRFHLRSIDKRLLLAVNELDHISDQILGRIPHDSTGSN